MPHRKRAAMALLTVLGLTVPMTGLAQADTSETGSIVIPLTDMGGAMTAAAEAGFDSGDSDEEPLEAPAPDVSTFAEETIDPNASGPDTPEASTNADRDSADESSAESDRVATDSQGIVVDSGDATQGMLNDEPNTAVAHDELSEDYFLLTEPIAIDDPFAVAGVTWAAGESLPVGASVEIRTLDGESWSQWFALETEESGGSREGTEYNISGSSTGIQVRITKGDGELPSDLRIDIAYSGDGEVRVEEETEVTEVVPTPESLTDEVVNPATAVSTLVDSAWPEAVDAPIAAQSEIAAQPDTGTARPAVSLLSDTSAANALADVKPRSAWGASESIMTWPVEYATFQGVIVHHTAGSSNYSQAEVPTVIQGIYHYHAVSLGWGDIGYNVLVDKYGGRWEGRTGTLASAANTMAIGGHAAPRNTGTMGVSVLGNYSELDPATGKLRVPSDTVQRAISDVAAWKFAVAGVDPRSTSPLKVPLPSEKPTNSSLTPGSPLPRIAGHRDVSNTACPGSIYTFMTQIRNTTAASYDSLTKVPEPTPTPTPTPTPDPEGPTFYLNDAWTGQANTVFSWGDASDEILVGDWNGDGKDNVALRRGVSFAFATQSPPDDAPSFTTAYGRPGDEVFVGDWDGDGQDTLAVRRGNMFYIKNSISGGEADAVFAYGRAEDAILVGDWDGDGKDTLAVRRGNQYHVRNILIGGNADFTVAYGEPTDDVYVGSFSKEHSSDSLAVRRGYRYYISYTIRGGAADIELAYGRAGDETLVGDWDGDGTDTLGVRRK